MALDKTRWGNAVAAAVQAAGITDDAEITPSQLQVVWQAICDEHKTELSDNLQAVGTTTVTGGSSAGTHPSTIPAGGHS